MASIHKDSKGRSPYWFCAFITPDGKRRFKSTKTTDKKQAQQVCRAWEKAARIGWSGKLNPESAREIIAQGVADVFTASGGDGLPSSTTRGWCDRWLLSKQIGEPNTFTRYKHEINRLLEFLGSKADKDIAMVQSADISLYRDNLAKNLTVSTANMFLKVVRVCLGAAVKQNFLTANPASRVDKLKQRGEAKRRAFTPEELKRILQAARDTEWQGLILCSLYLGGARLGDVARFTWRNIDLEKEVATFQTRKTARRHIIPLHPSLKAYLENLSSSDNPNSPIFPNSYEKAEKRVGTLSNQFYELLVQAGLAEPRTHEASKKGRGVAREMSELSFHSLRHTATTFLKACGVSDVLARELVGHESESISRNYTHLSTEDLRKAIEKLPDVTKAK